MAAQVPWVSMPGAPTFVANPSPYGNPDKVNTLLSAPAPNTLWGIYGLSGFRYGSSTLYRTTDNGQTWQSTLVASNSYSITVTGTVLVDFSVLDAQTAWVFSRSVGFSASPLLLRTYSGPAGLTDIASSGLPAQSVGLHFFTATRGVCVAPPAIGSSSWEIYRTINGGTSWTRLATMLPVSKNYYFSQLSKAALGTCLWFGTEDGDVMRTVNNGLTWSKAPAKLAGAVGGLVFRDALHGLAYSLTGKLARTTDGGATWQPLPTPWPAQVVSLAVQPGTSTYIGVAATQSTSTTPVSSLLAVSTDDGDSWQTQRIGDVPYKQLSISANGQLWAATFRPYVSPYPTIPTPQLYDMLLRYTGTPLASQPTGTVVAAPAVQDTLAYPNPANSLVQLPDISDKTVRVYDAQGHLYASSEPAGTLDFSAAPAGLYFIILTSATGATYTQRLAVVH